MEPRRRRFSNPVLQEFFESHIFWHPVTFFDDGSFEVSKELFYSDPVLQEDLEEFTYQSIVVFVAQQREIGNNNPSMEDLEHGVFPTPPPSPGLSASSEAAAANDTDGNNGDDHGSMVNESRQGEAREMVVAVRGAGTKRGFRKKKPKTFFRYMDLPLALRQRIRIEAVNTARGNFRAGEKTGLRCSQMAAVAKEWQRDIEEVLFGEMHIDPSDAREVSKFKELFTDERKKLLRRLDIAVDDSENGPWYQWLGLAKISQIIFKTGKLLHYINGWDFGMTDGGRRHIEIVFATSRFPHERIHWPKDHRLDMNTTSLWWNDTLYRATAYASVPEHTLINPGMVVGAIMGTFPPTLNMVTHLSFPPDCMPLLAAKMIIASMPNLESCVLHTKLCYIPETWADFTDCIRILPSSVPSLRSLTLSNTKRWTPWDAYELLDNNTHQKFAATLRDYSQRLESLRANPFELHEEFLRPFSPICKKVYSTTWRWPRLRHLDLQFLDEPSPVDDDDGWDQYRDPVDEKWALESGYRQPSGREQPLSNQGALANHQNLDSPEMWTSEDEDEDEDEEEDEDEDEDEDGDAMITADFLIAAGRAAQAMPVLESAHISVNSEARGNPGIFVKRKLCPKTGGTLSSRVWISRVVWHEDRIAIMDAWAHFLGPDPEYDSGLMSEFYEPYSSDR